MAELTIQDVADYLANNGYTTWADLTRQKTLTETGLWSVLQHNYDSNHAINMGYIDLSDYLSETAMKQWVQGRGYVTESSIKSWVRAQGYITSVPGTDLTGYATQQWVLGRGFLTSHQSLADYATKQYADSKIIGLASQSWVSQNYATQASLGNYLPLSGGTLTGDIESQDIIPVADNTYSLGTSAKRWSIIRTMKADFAGEIYTHGKVYAYGNIQPMPNSNNVYPQLGTSASRWANVVTSGVNCAGNIIPATTETYQLGTSQYRWNNVITKSVDATGTSSLAALIVNGSATFKNGINITTGSLTIGGCTISWEPSVGMLHFSTGIYSDGAVTAGGVGTSGGGGGGGLSWANLAASTTEQIARSHLTTALSGYVSLSSAQVISGAKDFTSRIKVSDVGDLYVGGVFYDSYDWVGLWSQHDILIQSESDVLIDGELVDINSVSGTYVSGTFDVSGAVSISSTLTASGQVTAKKFVATDYNSSDSLLRGDGTATSLLGLFSSMFVSGSTLYVTVGGTSKNVTLPSGNNMVTTNTTQTITGEKTFNNIFANNLVAYYTSQLNGGMYLDVDSSCYLGYGVNNHIGCWSMIFSVADGDEFMWSADDTMIMRLDQGGYLYATSFENISDQRRKTLYGEPLLTVRDISSMPAVKFKWNSGRDTKMHVGTIAQAWQGLLPEVVSESPDGYLSMDYASTALVSAITIAKAVDDHERRILDLEAENRRLKQEIEELKTA